MRVAVALVVLACACGDDPSLRVIVEHDPDLATAIARTTVTVYEGDELACTDIEFGDVSGPALAGFAVATLDTSVGGSFDGQLSRLGGKVVVARGFDDRGRLIVAQCADVDEVVEGASVTIVTTETATVSLAAAEDTKRGILVIATDANTRPIDDRPVSWRLFGAAGTAADEALFTTISDGVWEPRSPTCTVGGEATIHPTPPDVMGAFAIQARVSWEAGRPALFTQFTPIDLVVTDPLEPAIGQPCAVRRTATARGVVCLTSPTQAVEYTGTTLTKRPTQTLPSAAVGLVSIEQNGALDVYAITATGGWHPVSGAPPVSPRRWCSPGDGPVICDGIKTFDLQFVPACGDSPALLAGKIGLTALQTQIRVMDIATGDVEIFRENGDALGAAGCLTEVQPDGTTQTRQAVVLERRTGAPARVVFDCAASAVGCEIPLLSSGVGFLRGDESQMIVSSFDATGTVLLRVVARAPDGPGQDRLIERSRQSSASPPSQLVVGRYDLDSELDLIWHFPTFNGVASNAQLSYARAVEGDPITGILPAFGQIIDLLTADLDSNMLDEAMVVIDRSEGGAVVRRLQLVALGTPYTPVEQVLDAPCQ